MQTRGGVLADPVVALGAAESMLEAVEGQGWRAQNDFRSTLLAAEVLFPDFMPTGTRRVKTPRLLVDGMFIRAVVVKLLPGGWDEVKKIIYPGDHEWVWLLWKSWSRNVWIDWISGSVAPTGHAGWGLAPEVQAAMGEVLRKEDLYTWGKVTRRTIIARSLHLEMGSRHLFKEEKVWMGC
uniref:Uncharacterized protein n=1 Tax=viral metagenome TaxID=1070528 RepID=A0A2V0RL98_9ZZZZ